MREVLGSIKIVVLGLPWQMISTCLSLPLGLQTYARSVRWTLLPVQSIALGMGQDLVQGLPHHWRFHIPALSPHPHLRVLMLGTWIGLRLTHL